MSAPETPHVPVDFLGVRARGSGARRRFWKSLDELASTPAFRDLVHREFPEQASQFDDPEGRREFMKVMGGMMKDVEQPNDEVFLFHRASGLAIAGHNFQFMYKPKGYKPEPKFKLAMGGFPVSWLFSMMMPKGSFRSSLEGQPAPIADSKLHAETWARVLDWNIKAWTSAHDPPRVVAFGLELCQDFFDGHARRLYAQL